MNSEPVFALVASFAGAAIGALHSLEDSFAVAETDGVHFAVFVLVVSFVGAAIDVMHSEPAFVREASFAGAATEPPVW